MFQDDLTELLRYIKLHYRKKVGHLYVTTNGTIMPTDQLCIAMKESDVLLQIDDYSGSIEESKIVIKQIVEKCEQYGIKHIVRIADRWFDLGLGKVDNSEYSEEELCNYFIVCQQEWTELYDEKLSNCNYNSYAVRAKLMEEYPEETYNLNNRTEEDKMVLFEYSRGYSEKGYFEMCKKCKGYLGINKNYVAVAEQQKE